MDFEVPQFLYKLMCLVMEGKNPPVLERFRENWSRAKEEEKKRGSCTAMYMLGDMNCRDVDCSMNILCTSEGVSVMYWSKATKTSLQQFDLNFAGKSEELCAKLAANFILQYTTKDIIEASLTGT